MSNLLIDHPEGEAAHELALDEPLENHERRHRGERRGREFGRLEKDSMATASALVCTAVALMHQKGLVPGQDDRDSARYNLPIMGGKRLSDDLAFRQSFSCHSL